MNTSPDGYLDRSFDGEFSNLELKWLPWVGSSYRDSEYKTIALGESIYLYGGEASREKILDMNSLRQRHINHGILAKFKSRYLRNFERAVFHKNRPNKLERTHLWTKVVYYNLVPRLLDSLKARPSDNDYARGWQDFLRIAEVVQADRCIVYGLESRKIRALIDILSQESIESHQKRLTDVGKNRPLVLSFQLNSRPIELLFIRHPSAFFAWEKWALTLRDAGMLPVGPLLAEVTSET